MTVDKKILLVGIASSAGGLIPLEELIKEAICHENMAFIVVPHLSRDYESALPNILKRVSKLKVKVISDSMTIERCHLYVLPPNYYARVENNLLILDKRPDDGINQSANILFDSLTKYYGKNSIGVILSGAAAGADGSEGIVAIKEAGGHTYAQTPASAQFPQMPEAAIATGAIDSILEPAQIGHELTLVSWAADT